MITVRFYGGLKQFGDRFELAANSPAEAIYALTSQIAGLRKYIEAGVFKVRMGSRAVAQEAAETELRQGFEGTLHITPVARGSGKSGGIIKIIVGIILLVVSYYTGGSTASAAMAMFSQAALSLGMALIVSGVSDIMAKPPQPMDASGASKNTAFSNLGNTVGQGKPVPVAYGLCYTGSKVVSMGVETRKLSNEQIKELSKASDEDNPKYNDLIRSEAKRKADRVRRKFIIGKRLANEVLETAEMEIAKRAEKKVLDDPSLSELQRRNLIKKSLGIPANGTPDSRGWEFEVVKTPLEGVAAIAPNGVPYNTDFNHPSVAAQNYKSEFRVDIDYQLRVKEIESGEVRRKLAAAESEQSETGKKLQGQLSDDERRNLEKRLEVLDTEVIQLRKILEV